MERHTRPEFSSLPDSKRIVWESQKHIVHDSEGCSTQSYIFERYTGREELGACYARHAFRRVKVIAVLGKCPWSERHCTIWGKLHGNRLWQLPRCDSFWYWGLTLLMMASCLHKLFFVWQLLSRIASPQHHARGTVWPQENSSSAVKQHCQARSAVRQVLHQLDIASAFAGAICSAERQAALMQLLLKCPICYILCL